MFSIRKKQDLKREVAKCYPSYQVGNLQKRRPLLYKTLKNIAESENESIINILKDWGFNTTMFEIEEMQTDIFHFYNEDVVDISLDRLPENLKKQIIIAANSNGISVSDFLNALGFDTEEKQSDAMLAKLSLIFPNKEVKDLKNNHPILYKGLNKLAFHNNLDISDFLNLHGFSYWKKNRKKVVTKEDLAKELLEIYPDKLVRSLSCTNQKLYQKVRLQAVNSNLTINGLLNDLGFEVFKKPKREDLGLLEKLAELYPSKEVTFLIKKDVDLYRKLSAQAVKNDMNIKKYLETKGFIYNTFSSKGYLMTKEEVLESILELYPDRVVTSLSSRNIYLYQRISKMAKKENLSYKQFLAKNGFNQNPSKKIVFATEEELVSKLLEVFPDKHCKQFYLKDINLFREVKRYAASSGYVSTGKYLNSLGFTYEKRATLRKINSEEELFAALHENFPNKEVDSLFKKNYELYYAANTFATKQGKKLQEYLNEFQLS